MAWEDVTETDVRRALAAIRPARRRTARARPAARHDGAGGLPGDPTSMPRERLDGLGRAASDIVVTRLAEARRSAPGDDGPAADAAEAVRCDFSAGDPIRETWSALYHRFVAPEPFPLQRLAVAAGLDATAGRRQIHRRIRHGVRLVLVEVRREHAVPAAEARPRGGPLHPELPSFAGPFVGRKAVLHDGAARLAAAPALTVVGPPGVGKSRLVRERVRALETAFDAVAWVDAAASDSLGALAAAVARALGLPHPDPAAPVAAGAPWSRLEGRRVLVVLDNADDRVDACAAVAGAVLSAGGGNRVVATGCERLNVEGEHVFRLAPLALPGDADQGDADPEAMAGGAGSAPDALWRSDAAALFVHGLAARRASAAVTAADVPAVVTVLAHTGGLPLAIERAAAAAAAGGIAALAARLDHGGHLLDVVCPTAPARQASLRAALERADARLDDDARAVFDAVCAFDGPFSLLDAATRAPDPPLANAPARAAIARHLATLVEHGLVLPAPAVAGQADYAVPAPFRALGRARQAAAGPAAAVPRLGHDVARPPAPTRRRPVYH